MYSAHMTIDDELLRLRDEARNLRQKTGRVCQSLAMYKDKATRLEKENTLLRKEMEKIRKKEKQLEEELEKVKHQRDTYKGIVFKPKHRSTPSDHKSDIKRFRGGQTGHKGYGRKLPPKPDRHKRIFCHHCPVCSALLQRSDNTDSHTVTDIPAPETIKPVVIEYHTERQWCPKCKKEVTAVPPEIIPNSRLGINLVIQLLIWKYGCRIPLNLIVELFSSTYSITVSQGALIGILHRTRKWLGPYYDRILANIRAAPVKHADETGWTIAGVKGWLWAFLTGNEVYYTIEETRGKGVPQKILGGSKETDVLVRDGYAGYEKLPMKQQSCWAHPLRNSHEEVISPDVSLEMKILHGKLKIIYGVLQEETDRPFDIKRRKPIHKEILGRLTAIINTQYQAVDSLRIQTRIRNQGETLLTALLVPGVPLTNNLAEQMIRPMVITRKISGGSRSDEGAMTHAVNMSVFQTLKIRNQPIIPTLRNYILKGISGNTE